MRQFLHVPQRVHNAVMLMVDLAENNQSDVFVSLTEIAERQKLSRGFLEEVVAQLKEAGLVTAKRGALGGYQLAHAADEISIGDIVLAIEGPLTLVECLGSSTCAIARHCPSKSVWRAVQGHIEDTLAAISLADVIDKNQL
ncbi:Rrf2 family transcriptional regulator [Patescibacteria group bacterium]|nr:Rrf2 family transcriptional regulator [Patescibacteria group bacterium]MBU1916434.1 Rrf2 family transcriptional regulator [Patescibacteria group bacterium]